MNKKFTRVGALVLVLSLAGAAAAQNRPGDELSTLGPEQRRELQEQQNQRNQQNLNAVPYGNRNFGRVEERRMDRRVDRRSAAERRADARRNDRHDKERRSWR